MTMRAFFIFFLFLVAYNSLVCEEPWGKDESLIYRSTVSSTPCPPSLLARMGERMIKFHQDVISPADGPRSHFIPSSSQYTLDAMRKYGFFKGYIMGCDRLMRENSDPWVYPKVKDENGQTMKWNPVK